MSLSRRRSYVDTRVFAALTALAVFSLATTLVTIISVAKMVEARQLGLTYSAARTSVGDLLTQITAAESSQRGYLLTNGDASYLTPYHDAAATIPGDLSTLKTDLAHTPYMVQINTLATVTASKLAELASTLSVFQTQGQSAALEIVQTGAGQADMTKIRSQAGAILTSLGSEVAESRVSVAHYANLARDVGILSLAGTLILVVGIYFLFDHAIEAERALDRAKDEFVSLASHQLRTPATGIKSILSMLAAGDFGPLSERQQDVLGKAVMSNERELAIIEELLNVAKADAGRLVLNPVELDLSALIDQIISEQQPAIAAKQLKLEYAPPANPVTIYADEEKLYMAISNLLDNARKYTPDAGSIRVGITHGRNQTMVEVSDSGIGIEEHELDHIFDRFQRSRMVLAGSIEGTGLGLYLARRIAELHHGTINVDSKKGHGSKFIIVLPRRTAA